jgi:hypothetical protein
MKDDPPLTLGLVTPGTGYKDATGQPIEIFRCPACKEYINTSMTKCRFCHAPVDQATLARARVQERIDRVCRLAAGILRFWWFMPVIFWAMAVWTYTDWKNFLFFYSLEPRFARWQLIPVISLAAIITVWLQIRRVEAVDPNLEKAERVMKVSLLLWVLTFPVPLIILFAARPDLLGPISKMVFWNQSKSAVSVVVLVVAAAILAWRAWGALRRVVG